VGEFEIRPGKGQAVLDVSCIVLAGGKSSRLGRNKVVEKIGNQSLLERAISALLPLECEVIVVAGANSSLPELKDYPEVKIVKDIYPGKGSLGGIYTGLVSSKSFHNLVIGCDMPFLQIGLVKYLFEIAYGYDVVVPKLKDGIFEPLHAVYSQNCIVPLELLVKQDILKILELYEMVTVRYVGLQEIERFDPQHVSFFNINTEMDLKSGRELAGKEVAQSD
jgi:molybdopterin-guanine dinucleotide biosynthesis protein A